MRGLALSLALLAAGCGGHSNVQLASSGAPSGGVATGGSLNIQGRSTLGVLIAIGILAGTSYARDGGYESCDVQHRSSPFMPLRRSHRVPELDAARSVNEQDCSRPIENPTANLRCR